MDRFSRLASLAALFASSSILAIACSSDPADTPQTGDEDYLTAACTGAAVDDHGFCRKPNGQFAKKSCCLPNAACESATLDEGGVCRRKDNGQFAPAACCEALCEGASLDDAGVCRKDDGQFALGACCADECASGGCDAEITADRFADDLRDALVDYYAAHGGDIVGSGGNSLADAQAAVDASLVLTLENADEDPHAHDFADFVVFSHPDVTFPGSDIVWFGAYDIETGTLESVYDFN
jgi:hypothetical protein